MAVCIKAQKRVGGRFFYRREGGVGKKGGRRVLAGGERERERETLPLGGVIAAAPCHLNTDAGVALSPPHLTSPQNSPRMDTTNRLISLMGN